VSTNQPYHHGNLRREILDAALASIEESGPVSLSLRDLARCAGVSHAAPAHHFGDKAGLLTAIAIEGYELLIAALRTAHATGTFLDVGVAYIEFAITHPAHFEVMFRPDLLHCDDPELTAIRRASARELYGPASETLPERDTLRVGVAGWAFAHGFASLWAAGSLPDRLGRDPIAAARSVGALLFAGPARKR
jgi:AcrR family transcriptional regulator